MCHIFSHFKQNACLKSLKHNFWSKFDSGFASWRSWKKKGRWPHLSTSDFVRWQTLSNVTGRTAATVWSSFDGQRGRGSDKVEFWSCLSRLSNSPRCLPKPMPFGDNEKMLHEGFLLAEQRATTGESWKMFCPRQKEEEERQRFEEAHPKLNV